MNDPKNHRVLVIDDNRSIHDDIRKILTPQNGSQATEELADIERRLFGHDGDEKFFSRARFQVDSAFQGEEGVHLVERSLESGRPYELAFVDMRMPPGIDGMETIDRLWRVDPDLHTVICTAYSDHSWEEIVTRLGVHDRLLILKKPFDNVELLQIAYALSHKWHLARETRLRLNDVQMENERLVAAMESVTGHSPAVVLFELAELLGADETPVRIAAQAGEVDRVVSLTARHATRDRLERNLSALVTRLGASPRAAVRWAWRSPEDVTVDVTMPRVTEGDDARKVA